MVFLEKSIAFLKRHGLLNHAARFDVVAVTWPKTVRRADVEHFQDVFEASLAGHEMS